MIQRLVNQFFRLRGRFGNRAPRELWLHVGVHKTGSTFLQDRLSERRNRLRWQGLFYESDSRGLARILQSDAPLPAQRVRQLADQWQTRLQSIPEPIVLLSSERFFGNPYEHYEQTRAIAEDLRRVFEGLAIRIFVCVRRQDQFLESLYHQHIKEGGTVSFPEFLCRLQLSAFDWGRLLAHWATVFGSDNVHVRSYESLFADPPVAVTRFFSLPARAVQCPARHTPVANPSYSSLGLELARRCNDLLDVPQQRALRGFLQHTFPKLPGADFGLFNDRQRDELLTMYAESNARLCQEFLSPADAQHYALKSPTVPAGTAGS